MICFLNPATLAIATLHIDSSLGIFSLIIGWLSSNQLFKFRSVKDNSITGNDLQLSNITSNCLQVSKYYIRVTSNNPSIFIHNILSIFSINEIQNLCIKPAIKEITKLCKISAQ